MKLGKYEVRGEIARGGAGAVFEAVNPQLPDRSVAIKLLHAGADLTASRRARFQRESEALGRLRHPNIVAVREVGVERGNPFLVMDLIHGRTLTQVVEERGPLAPRQAVGLTVELALALDYAHQAGVLHRDVKPDNVVLTLDGAPHLTDFGMVKYLDDERSGLTKSGMCLGTPGYWPPEQALGDLDALSPASDVYGLGATLFFALTGECPFSFASMIEAMLAARDQTPRPPSALRMIPGKLDRIVMRCLEKDPARRFESAVDLAHELERFLAGRSRSLEVPAAVVASCLLLAVTGVTLWLSASGDSPPAPPTRPSLAPSPAPSAAPTPVPPPVPSATPGIDRAEALRLHRLAKTNLEGGALKKAIALYTEGLRLDPQNVNMLVERGNARATYGDRRAAIADYTRALDLAPDNPEIWAERAWTRDELEDYLGSASDYRRAVELAPRRAVLHNNLGRALIDAGKPEEALAPLGRALRLQRLGAAPLFNLGLAHDALGNRAEAIDHYRQFLLQATPKNASRAYALQAMKRLEGPR